MKRRNGVVVNMFFISRRHSVIFSSRFPNFFTHARSFDEKEPRRLLVPLHPLNLAAQCGHRNQCPVTAFFWVGRRGRKVGEVVRWVFK